MADYCKMWESLGLDLEAHDKLLSVIPPLYQQVYLDQVRRPDKMDYFDFVITEIHGLRIQELVEHKEKGGKVIGTFCLYVPEEIVIAAGGVCIGLCAGAEVGMDEAEKVLPRNTCSLIKSFMGFKLAKICPYFESCDLIIGETTCDGKKKAFEVLNEFSPVYVMELPQMKRETDRKFWAEEVGCFKEKIEELTGNKITAESLKGAIKLVNDKRRALQRLNSLRANNPAPISGKDALLLSQIAFYDNVERFTLKVNELADELEEKVKAGEGVAAQDAPRVIISGCPMVIPNWKLPHIIESSGAVIVGEESCTGYRYYSGLVDESAETIDEMLGAISERYFGINCACFTPNKPRLDDLKNMATEFKADGVIHHSLQFCDPYTIESYDVDKAMKKAGIPMLKIETDYSQEDAGQLQTRVEAFLEMIKK